MSTFFKSAMGIAMLSVAMIAGMGQSNEAEARPYGYGGGYRGGYSSYYGPRYYSGYRYNAYRPYYGGYGYNNYYYGRPYGYNSYYYGPRNSVNLGGVRIGW